MVWDDMICCEMLWDAMRCYGMLSWHERWYEMRWWDLTRYEMTRHGMIWYDIIWNDAVWCGIWYIWYTMCDMWKWYVTSDMIWYATTCLFNFKAKMLLNENNFHMIWCDVAWCMIYDIWHMMYDIRHTKIDIWCMMHALCMYDILDMCMYVCVYIYIMYVYIYIIYIYACVYKEINKCRRMYVLHS